MNIFFYLGLVMGIFMGIIGTYAVMVTYNNEHEKARQSWEAVINKKIIYNLRAGRRRTKSGKSIFNWGETLVGIVNDVKSTHKLVKINGHWYKWQEINLVSEESK